MGQTEKKESIHPIQRAVTTEDEEEPAQTKGNLPM